MHLLFIITDYVIASLASQHYCDFASWHSRFFYSFSSIQLKKNDDASYSFLPSYSEMPSICDSTESDLQLSRSMPSIGDLSSIEFPSPCESNLEISAPGFFPSLEKIDSDLSSSMRFLENSPQHYVLPPMFYDTNMSTTESDLDISMPDYEWDYPMTEPLIRRRLCDLQILGYECNEHE